MTQTTLSIGARYWRARLGRWPAPKTDTGGYSLIVPVPGDLPVFLRLALAVIMHQEARHRVETLVVPDAMTSAMRQTVREARALWVGSLRLLPLPPPERWVLPRLNNPGRNHALQLLTGTSQARGSHVVFHDADLFLMSPDVLDRNYLTCRDRGLACLGVSPVWDPWFSEHGRRLAATWELCARVDWLRSFVPALHMGHDNELFGERHTFDTTLYPQAITHPELIDVATSEEVVHFNYVISQYRHYLRAGAKCRDERFLLVFVRLIIDLFDQANASRYRLPTLAELGASLGRSTTPVTFPGVSEGAERYKYFRQLLGRVVEGPWCSPGQRGAVFDSLKAFDRFYRAA